MHRRIESGARLGRRPSTHVSVMRVGPKVYLVVGRSEGEAAARDEANSFNAYCHPYNTYRVITTQVLRYTKGPL